MTGNDRESNTSRREVLSAGSWAALGGLGLAAGTLFSGIRPRAAQAAPKPTRSTGAVDPAIGERGRKTVAGYVGRSNGRRTAGVQRQAVPTSCLQCVAICGVTGFVEDGRLVKIDGNPEAPNNRGMICAKGQAGVNQVYDPDRLLHPLVRVGERGEGRWKRISMKEALDLVAFGGEIAGKQRAGLKEIRESGHPEHFMLHYGRSRIKGALNHFCKDAMGTGTIGNHTSICEVGKWTGQELSVGAHYDINDAANSRYILVFGANVLEAHTSHSYLAQRVIEAKSAGAKLVTFDVRQSNTAAVSDEWIPVLPGTDLAVILAMTNVVLNEQPYGRPLYDEAFIRSWTNASLEELQDHYRPYTTEWASGESGVPADVIRRIAIEYASTRPATIITYRGFVGHYNGAYAEFAVKALEGIAGNLMIEGGTHMKVSGKWQDAYASVNEKHPDAVAKAKKLKVIDGDGILLPTHHVSQWVFEQIASGKAGRPRLYMTYCWNGAYTCGDGARTREILENEEYFPFIVAVDTGMGELTSMADLILPDATYLERWAAEAPQSYPLLPFLQIRQPVTPPLGEAMDIQDMFIQLARRVGGKPAELHPYDTAGDYIRACFQKTVDKANASGKPLLTAEGKPIEGDPWQHMLEHGVVLQGNKPQYRANRKRVSSKDLKGTVVDDETGVVWNPAKAKVSAAEARAKGYRATKNAYKGYVGQMVEGVAYKGFKPDKINKSGLLEVRSQYLADAADAVWGDISDVIRPEESFVQEHLRSGLPCFVPVPEHRRKLAEHLYLISFKVNVQIHSRSQNCKWLQEIYHKNPLWLHPQTARKLFGDEVEEGMLVRIEQAMPKLPGDERRNLTKVGSVTARVHLTEGIHPSVVALSFHCGHWAHGRYASGKGMDPALTGAEQTGEKIWWQRGMKPEELEDPTEWSDIRGVHPNWIIPNTPARVSGQFRSNDTLVRLSLA